MDLLNKKKIKLLQEENKQLLEKAIHADDRGKENIKLLDIISDYKETNDLLINENKKLNEWIRNILKEFGTYDVSERKVSIPIYRRTELKPYSMNSSLKRIGQEETIVIPEIVLRKITRF